MKPLCLIIPPSPFLLDERVFMSLGILKVAAVLEQSAYPIEMLDLSGIENFEDVVRAHITDTSSRFFGISATTPQMPSVAKIVRALRPLRPDARVILGGPHITLVNAARKKELKRGKAGRAVAVFEQHAKMFDVMVAGDGERAVFEALGDCPPKLIDADDPNSPLFLKNSDLGELPFPSRHLVDVDSYRYTIDSVRALSMIAQLGCPFECGFCGGRQSPMLRRVRLRSVENVVSEMDVLYRSYGIRGFMMYDDELNVNTQMIHLMQSISELQRNLGAEFRLRGFIKAQLFTEAQAEAMWKAGFRWILVGFESGSPRILENINKRSTCEQNTRCLETARKHGLKVKALMSIGHPGESEQTVRETRDWLLEVKPDDFDVTIITPYPGSPYYDEAVPRGEDSLVWEYSYGKTGDKLYSYEVDYTQVAEYYKGNPEGGYRSYVFTDSLDPDALVGLRDWVERSVRKELGIPFNPVAAMMRYEHSMGQFGLPPNILRKSRETALRS